MKTQKLTTESLLVHKFFISMGYVFFKALWKLTTDFQEPNLRGKKKSKSKITIPSNASILLLFFSYLEHLYNLMDISVRTKVSFKGKLV